MPTELKNKEWNKFGNQCGESRWFKGEPVTDRVRVETFREKWSCPCEGCKGEMIFNGMTWPTGDPGYHHTCNSCQFTAAVHAQYPRTIHVESPDS